MPRPDPVRVVSAGLQPMSARESRRKAARRQAKMRPVLTGYHVINNATGRCETCNCPAIKGMCH